MSNFVKSLESDVEQDEQERRRKAILVRLKTKPTATLEDLYNVCENSKLGDVMKTLTLEDLWSIAPGAEVEDEEEETEAEAAPRKGGRKSKKRGKKKSKKKSKKRGKKKSAKKSTKKKSKKRGKKKSAAAKSNGASDGRRKRADYDQLAEEVVAYMQKEGEPLSTGDLTDKFGISAAQARKVFDQLAGEKKVKRIGGGRGTKYDLR